MEAFNRTLTLENVGHKLTKIGRSVSKNPYGVLRQIKVELLVNHYKNGKIIIPDVQRIRDESIINNMVATCEDNVYTLIHSSNPLQLCVCEGVYALIDGQHRMETFRIIMDKYPEKLEGVEISIHIYNDVDELEMYRLYMNLNINNPDINSQMNCLEDLFRVKNYSKMKRKIIEQFPSSFKKGTNVYGIDEFVSTLMEYNYLNYYSTIDKAYEYLVNINDSCYEYYEQDTIDNMTSIEYDIYHTGFIGSLKRNNFFDILMLDEPNYDDFNHVIPKRGRPDTKRPLKKNCTR